MAKPQVFVTRIIPEAGLSRVQAACAAEIWPGRERQTNLRGAN